ERSTWSVGDRPSRPTPRWRLRAAVSAFRPAAASTSSLRATGALRPTGRAGFSVPVASPKSGGSLAGNVRSRALSIFFSTSFPIYRSLVDAYAEAAQLVVARQGCVG